VASIGSLLLAYGRFAPFYKFFYLLPYASTIRIPTKIPHHLFCAIVTLFAYGIQRLGPALFGKFRRPNANSPLAQFKKLVDESTRL